MSQQETISARNWTIAIFSIAGIFITIVVLGLLFLKLGTRDNSSDQFEREAIRERLKPIGEVVLGTATTDAATQVAENTPPKSAQEIYETVCAACHATGVLNSPKLGDKAAWAERFAKGKETLITNALNGLNQMPARGGQPALTDEEVQKTVEYLLAESGIGASTSEAAPVEEAAAAPEAVQAEAAVTPAEATPAETTTTPEEATPASNE